MNRVDIVNRVFRVNRVHRVGLGKESCRVNRVCEQSEQSVQSV